MLQAVDELFEDQKRFHERGDQCLVKFVMSLFMAEALTVDMVLSYTLELIAQKIVFIILLGACSNNQFIVPLRST